MELIPTKRDIPLTRKITQTLYESAVNIQLAIDKDDLDPIIKQNDSDGVVISANICSAIVDMYDATSDSDIILSPEWSKEISIDNADIPKELTFKREHRQAIEGVARDLTPQKAPSKEELSGFVKRLDRNVGDIEGKVAITVGSDSRIVTLTLEHQDYEKAITAHKTEVPVYFSGTIERRGNNLRVVELDHFEMMKKPD